jgi:hypothetical protein
MQIKKLIPLLLMLFACGKEATIKPPPKAAYLMFYNGAPDFYNARSMVLVNNQHAGQLAYNDNGRGLIGAYNTSLYQFTDTGDFRIAFSDSTIKAAKITEGIYHFADKKHYTIYLADSLGFYETMYTSDDVNPDPGMAKIRLLHLSPDAGTISLLLDTSAVQGIQELHFRGVTHYIPVSPDIKPAIRIMNGDNQLVRKSFPLKAGKCYTMILRGYKNTADGDVNKTLNLSTIINF